MTEIEIIKMIAYETAAFNNVDLEVMLSKTRSNSLRGNEYAARSRMQAQYLAKKLTNESLEVIGYNIGCRDHATVLSAIKTIQNIIDTDSFFRNNHETLLKQLSKKIESIKKGEKQGDNKQHLIREIKKTSDYLNLLINKLNMLEI